jgi:hypothetical protein
MAPITLSKVKPPPVTTITKSGGFGSTLTTLGSSLQMGLSSGFKVLSSISSLYIEAAIAAVGGLMFLFNLLRK